MSLKFLDGYQANKDLPIPLYYQIAGFLREAIQSLGNIKEGDSEISLPTESELSDYFDVHRGTVRHALEILEREGLIYRERGRGTFLQRPRVEQDISTFLSTTEDLESRGWSTKTKLVGISKVNPRIHTKNVLEIGDGEQVWDVLRLRIANDEPIGLQRVFLPIKLTPDLNTYDLTLSLAKTMEQVYGIIFKQAYQIIRARKATNAEADLLGITEGDPLIVISGTSWDQYGRPIEDLDSFWRYDRYDLKVRHTRE